VDVLKSSPKRNVKKNKNKNVMLRDANNLIKRTNTWNKKQKKKQKKKTHFNNKILTTTKL